MDLEIKGHADLVTCGDRGIGREIALAFAREGANVAICGRDSDKLDQVAGEVAALGVACLAMSVDQTRPDDGRQVVEEASRRFGRVDVLVNNASTNVDMTPRSIEEATDEQLLVRVHGKAMAAIRCSRAARGIMRAGGGGRIVLIRGTSARTVIRSDESMSSGSSLPQGLGNASPSNFAKFLSEEGAPHNIIANVVHQYFTFTGRHLARLKEYAAAKGLSEKDAEAQLVRHMPIGRMEHPADIAPLVVLLGSSLSGATTGQSIAVDGGAGRQIVY